MSVVHLIDAVTEWARRTICPQIKLKVPPVSEDAVDAGYGYELVNPAAFSMYIPTSEKLPPGIHSPFPSICVNFVAGQDTPASGGGFVDVQFTFSTWDPGLHGKDIQMPVGDRKFRRWSGDEADTYFKRTGDGWRDAWNFVDIALREVESVTHIGGFVIDKATPIKFGPMTEQEAIADLYPTWFAWMIFRVTYPLTQRNIQDLQKYL